MTNYRGYTIKLIEAYGYYEIKNSNGKWFRNALTIDDAKEKIDLIENTRH